MKRLFVAMLLGVAFVLFGLSAEADAQSSEVGEWGPVQDWTIIPIHSTVLPDGKVLSFGTDANGIQGGNFIYNLWDPVTNEIQILPNTVGTNIFCSNMALDPNTGDIVITGGDQYRYGGAQWSGINDVVMFDYTTGQLKDSTVGEMNSARWYGSIITLPNGELLEMGGRNGSFVGSTIPEVFNSNTGFRELPGAEITDFLDDDASLRGTYYYAKTWVTSNGDVIVIESEGGGASRSDVYRMDVSGNGSVDDLGPVPFDLRNLGSGFMFDVDKVIVVANDGVAWIGDLSSYVPTWSQAFTVPDEDNFARGIARTNGTFVPMPDGRIALVGGSNSIGLLADSLGDGQKSILIWDPATNEIELTARQQIARMYHSTAQMLPDGRLWTGGGGAPGPQNNDDAEVFSPAYLFDSDGSLADRPVIIDAPSNISAGQTFDVVVEDASAIEMITAIKTGTATHGSTNEGRVYRLPFNVVDQNTIQVSTPGSTIMLPGLWMLSAVDSDGVPSKSTMLGVNMVQIEGTDPLNPDDTIIYNIDDEQIDGPFEVTVEAQFDDISDRAGQKVFDYADESGDERIWLGQDDASNDMEFAIVRNGVESAITAPDAIVAGELAAWTASVDSQGQMELSKNGTVVAQGAGQVPANVERVQLVGKSTAECCDDDLLGLVRNLALVNLNDLPNTAPEINMGLSTVTGDVFEPDEGAAPDTSTNGVTGVVAFFDDDITNTHTATATPQGANYIGMFKHAQPNTTDTTVVGDLWWSFGVADNMLNFLAEGQTRTQSYTITIDDGNGGTDSTTVTVTMIGTNDSPVISVEEADLSGQVQAIRDGAPGNGTATLSTSGGASFSDVDVTDLHTASFAAQTADAVGTFSVSASQNSVTWLFQVSDSALDALEPEQTFTQTYDLIITDTNGGIATETVTVVLVGPDLTDTNAEPTIDESASNLAGQVAELDNNSPGENIDDLTAVGSIVFVDTDGGDAHTATFQPQGTGYVGVLKLGSPTALSNPGSVSWTYTVNDADLDAAGAGEVFTQTYIVQVSDGQGGQATATLTITIVGAADGNSAPTIDASSSVTTGSVAELTDNAAGEGVDDVTASGAIVFADVDADSNFTSSASPASSDYLGTFVVDQPVSNAVAWTFTVNDGDLSDLGVDDTVVQTYQVAIADGSGGVAQADVVVTIVGAFDDLSAPTTIDRLDMSSADDIIVLGDNVTVERGGNFSRGTNSLTAGENFVLESGYFIFSSSTGDATLDLGNNADLDGNAVYMDKAGIANTFSVGADSKVGYIAMNGSYGSQSITLGANTTSRSSMTVGGRGTAAAPMDVDVAIGDGSSIDGYLSAGGYYTNRKITVGDDVTIRGGIYGGGASATSQIVIGDNFTTNGPIAGSASGPDAMVIGDEWKIGAPIYLYNGDNTLVLGSSSRDSSGAVVGGFGSDTLRLEVSGDDLIDVKDALQSARWTSDGNGSWTGGRTFRWSGVTFYYFETVVLPGSGEEPTPEPTPEVTPEPTPEVTPEPTPEPTPEVTPEPTPEVTPEPTVDPSLPLPPVGTDVVYFSLETDGLGFGNEDIATYSLLTGALRTYFDGSAVGLANADVDAFAMLEDGSLLLSLSEPFTVDGIDADDSDILRFVPTSLGDSTEGTFSLFVSGFDIGLTTDDEDVDALEVLSEDGQSVTLAVSTSGSFDAFGFAGNAQDVAVVTIDASGGVEWSAGLQGSTVGLDTVDENISATATVNGDLFISMIGDFDADGVTGDGIDIVGCAAIDPAGNPPCELSVFLNATVPGATIDALLLRGAL